MLSPKNLLRISTVVSVAALTLSVAVAPAYAMRDIAVDDSPRSFAATANDTQNTGDGMPDNPNSALPDTVSGRIPDDSTVVSEKLAVTPEGEVRNIETGRTVTDEALVGTRDQQPDPLAKTDGESFIPVSASDVKDAVEQPVKQSVERSTEQSSSKNGTTVRLAKFEGNDYGAHWGTYNNTKAFFDYKNNLFVQQAKGVIDVSSWQGDIDWAKAKADGVEGAIIRLGYGWGNDADAKAKRNINECKRLGIPFGIYWYSYAEDASGSRQEANDVVSKLRQLGVSPNDLKYPVYYDLERWTWTRTHASDRSERVQRHGQRLVRCDAVRRLYESWRVLVHQLSAGAVEQREHPCEDALGGAVRCSDGIYGIRHQRPRLAIHRKWPD